MSENDYADLRHVLAFGPFRLDRERRLLLNGEDEVRIGGRSFDLLAALLEKPSEVLGHQELVARAWPHVVVEDSSLRVNIAALRRVLSDGADGTRYIASVPGRGYSFVAAVQLLARPDDLLDISPVKVPNNLPIRLTRVIGREQAVVTVVGSLRKHRMATVVGHGGIGKTTLALAVAMELVEQYPEGVCFVDLAPLSDPSHVACALGAALGLAVSEIDCAELVNSYLAERCMLLVIDNCEHLIESTAMMIDSILRAAPKVHLLATSREPLNVEGEWVCRLAPLETPPEDHQLDCDSVSAYPALQLLVERVEASVDTFVLDKSNMTTAVAICRKLDGVPLAIEFVAARIGLIGLNNMAAQLDDRLRLLGTGRRTVLPRHRTLRALVDWSYDLLSDDEQLVLCRISLFRGSFTLESAISVLTDATISAIKVRDCIMSLVTKSLISVEVNRESRKYQLLKITRAYALEKLGLERNSNELDRRHAMEIVNLIKCSERDWHTMERSEWVCTYLHIVRDLGAALDWAFGPQGDPILGVELCTSVLVRSPQLLGIEEQVRRAIQAANAVSRGVPVTALQASRIDAALHYMNADDKPSE